MQRAAIFASGPAGRLRDEGHGARRARVDLEHVDHAVLDRELHVHQADDVERLRHRDGLAPHLLLHLLRQRVRRQRARRVAGVHAGLLDVLHDPADHDALAVADRVDVDLDRVVQEAVEQHRAVVADLDRLAHVALELALLVHDLHRAAAQHVARAHDQRVADLLGGRDRGGLGARRAVRRLPEAEPVQHLLEALAVLGHVDRVGRGADDRHAVALEVARELERRLAAELHDDAPRLLDVHDLEHVLERQRLEVQAVGGVVVGRDRLRVAVDHDGLEPVLAQRERRVHAAVVELDALPDAVRPAAQHHHLLPRSCGAPRTRPRRSSRGRRSASRTRRRRCRRACRPAAGRARGAARAPRPRCA